MISILIVGAGKSSTYLIDTLLKHTQKKNYKNRDSNWRVVVADSDEQNLIQKTQHYPNAEIAVLDINSTQQRQKLVKAADIVVSLMPPTLHILLAKDCLQFKKNLITSSYASDEMRELDQKVKDAGLMFMCEMGLDPGIDHMSASHIFNSVRKVASSITSFKSYCGGLIAPESDTNPWHYKFSWNPKNIINAGKGGAYYLEQGVKVHLEYEKLFANNKSIYCDGVGELAYYANRDSLSYIDLYQLHESKDFMRATLRHPEFCIGWNALIKLGATDTEKQINTDNCSFKDWIKHISDYEDTNISVQDHVWNKLGLSDNRIKNMIEWLDIFSDKTIDNGQMTSGDILLNILSEKWKMEDEDKDMVVMQHEIEYLFKGATNKLVSGLVVKGEDSNFSAMAKTVGLPMAILTELLMNKMIVAPTGVLIPTMPAIYRPILKRLEKYNIGFTESITM
jgi:saccharopine dehydrogenase-like NADP-dependent oxidoreductase